jgi:CubicO group peptidase (beta-lactamase class C family)
MKIHTTIAALLTLLSLGTMGMRADTPAPKSDAEVVSAVTAVVDRAVAEDRFSGAVLVAKDGKPLMARAWGMADPARQVANRPDTKFNLGSINKIFTKIAIGQLAAAGKLSLNDPVRKHLPNYPSPIADRITIQQLLDHKSGLGDFFGPKYLAAPPSSLRKLADFLPLFADKPLEFEPGAEQRYSNAGYLVLGLIVERLSGESYYDYVRDHITRPAGMKDTASYAIDESVPNRAIGQTKRGPTGPLEKRQDNTATLPGRGSSAGGGFSTAPDLLAFSQALLGDKLLPKPWTDWIFHDKVDSPGPRNLGIAGGAPGINAMLDINPPYTVVILANFDPPAAEEVGRALRSALGVPGREMRRRTQQATPDEVMIGGRVQLPMDISQRIPVIEAKVNGKGPFHFGVDTGFGGMLEVSAALATQLALPAVGEVMVGDPSGKNPKKRRLLHADSVDVGEVHLGGVEVAERTSPMRDGTDGIIGLPLFASLLVTFDYPNGQFRIDGGHLPAADGVSILSYTVEHGVPAIEIDVAGQKVKADIDSGSPAEVSLPLATAKSLPLAEEARVVGHARIGESAFDIYAAPLTGNVRIGESVLTNPRLDFIEGIPNGNVGYRFLKNFAVTYDPENHRVRFVKK